MASSASMVTRRDCCTVRRDRINVSKILTTANCPRNRALAAGSRTCHMLCQTNRICAVIIAPKCRRKSAPGTSFTSTAIILRPT